MMGERQTGQEALFSGFSLEQHVPDDHFLRSIDRFVDLYGVREHLRDYYNSTGRPSAWMGCPSSKSLGQSII